MSRVVSEVSGELDVDYHQFYLLEEETSGGVFDISSPLPLVIAAANGIFVSTGCAMGLVRLTVRLLDSEPADVGDGTGEGWEAQELVSIEARLPMWVTSATTGGWGEPAVTPAVPGPHRVRVSVRGDRAVNYDAVVDVPNEEYLVEFWPDTVLRDRVLVRDDGLHAPPEMPAPAPDGARGEVHVAASFQEAHGTVGRADAGRRLSAGQRERARRAVDRVLPELGVGVEGPGGPAGWATDLVNRTVHVWYRDPQEVADLVEDLRVREPSVQLVVHTAPYSQSDLWRIAEDHRLEDLAGALPDVQRDGTRTDGVGLVLYVDASADLDEVAELTARIAVPVPVWLTTAPPWGDDLVPSNHRLAMLGDDDPMIELADPTWSAMPDARAQALLDHATFDEDGRPTGPPPQVAPGEDWSLAGWSESPQVIWSVTSEEVSAAHEDVRPEDEDEDEDEDEVTVEVATEVTVEMFAGERFAGEIDDDVTVNFTRCVGLDDGLLPLVAPLRDDARTDAPRSVQPFRIDEAANVGTRYEGLLTALARWVRDGDELALDPHPGVRPIARDELEDVRVDVFLVPGADGQYLVEALHVRGERGWQTLEVGAATYGAGFDDPATRPASGLRRISWMNHTADGVEVMVCRVRGDLDEIEIAGRRRRVPPHGVVAAVARVDVPYLPERLG